MLKFIPLAVSLLFTQESFAGLSIPGLFIPPIKVQDNALEKAGLSEFHDEVVEEKNFQLTEAQLLAAKVWGLSEKEEKRYIQLMQSRSGTYYQGLNMTPVDILGLNARNDAERTHFAELAARQEAQKVAQNLAWNNAFYQAYNQLFKDIPVIGDFDPAPYSPYAHHPIELKEGESLYFFIQKDEAVTTLLLQLIDAVNRTQTTQLHLLFLGMNDEAIQLWANSHQIPMDLVTQKRISLNSGQKQYEALKLKHKETPLLLISNGKASEIIDLGRF